jgi:hypothetical protein
MLLNEKKKRKILGKKPSSDTGLGRWFREKWTAQSGEKCGSYTGKGKVKCRPSSRVTSKTPQTWGEMSDTEKRKAVRLKQKAHRMGKQFSSHRSGKIWDTKNNKYESKLSEAVDFFYNTMEDRLLLEKKRRKKKSKKPYKGYDPQKNHPEGGLSVSYARKLGIRAGVETKREAKKAGGFGKLKGKTKKRRKSFCKRMCGHKRKNTSAETAADPKSKINAALRVWGCRC